jgi:ATP-binding cassette subfamily B (MDR/TAP) protein 1
MGKDGPPGTAKKAAPALRSFASVFMHADAADAALMVLGLVGAMGDGLSTPVMLFITSRIFNDLGSGPDLLREFSSKINENARNLLFLALANWIMAFLGEPALRTH